MSTPTFGELLAKYMNRAGISDSELARTIGVQRQTIFRWKEGLVARPRVREDVLRCASKLRLTHVERDQLLLAAGFPPEILPAPAPAAEPVAVEPPTPITPAPIVPIPPAPAPAPLLSSADRPVTPLAQPRPVQSQWRWWSGLVALAGITLVVSWLLWPGALGPSLPRPTPATIHELPAAPPIATTPAVLLAQQVEPQAGTGVTDTATITATQPAEFWPRGAAGELLIVIAPFSDGQDPNATALAKRIQEALAAEIKASALTTVAVQVGPRALQDEVDARRVLSLTQATMVIWGGYDNSEVRAHWLVDESQQAQQQEFPFTSPSDRAVTITENVPKEMQLVAVYTLGRLFQNNGAYDKAEQAYRRVLALDPPNAELAALCNFYLGLLLARDKNSSQSVTNYDEGIRYYTNAYELDPQLYPALYNRGTLWLNRALQLTNTAEITSSLTQAISDYTALLEEPALRTRPKKPLDLADAYFNRGTAYYHRHQPSDPTHAVVDLTQTIALTPTNHVAWYQRAMAGIRAGQGLTWTVDLSVTLQLEPAYYRVYDAFCWGYALAQQPEQALPYCEIALQNEDRHKKEYSSHDAIGLVYAQLGRYSEASRSLESYLLWVKIYQQQKYELYRGPAVESWIATLKAQKNPFNPQLIAELR